MSVTSHPTPLLPARSAACSLMQIIPTTPNSNAGTHNEPIKSISIEQHCGKNRAHYLLPGGASGVRKRAWTTRERRIVVEYYRLPIAALTEMLPKRTRSGVRGYLHILRNEGAIPRKRAENFVRTEALDAEFAVAVACGASLTTLSKRFGRAETAIVRWKRMLGVDALQVRGAADAR